MRENRTNRVQHFTLPVEANYQREFWIIWMRKPTDGRVDNLLVISEKDSL